MAGSLRQGTRNGLELNIVALGFVELRFTHDRDGQNAELHVCEEKPIRRITVAVTVAARGLEKDDDYDLVRGDALEDQSSVFESVQKGMVINIH